MLNAVSYWLVMLRSAKSLILEDYYGSNDMYVPSRNYLAPWSPTPLEILEKMLELAKIQTGEVLCDICCGDGRFLVAGSGIYGIRSIGYEQDGRLAEVSKRNIAANGLDHLATVIRGDVFNFRDFGTDVDLTDADVVVLYLITGGMQTVRDRLAPHFKKRARIVSHHYPFEGVKPRLVRSLYSPKYDLRRRILVYYAEDLKQPTDKS